MSHFPFNRRDNKQYLLLDSGKYILEGVEPGVQPIRAGAHGIDGYLCPCTPPPVRLSTWYAHHLEQGRLGSCFFWRLEKGLQALMDPEVHGMKSTGVYVV